MTAKDKALLASFREAIMEFERELVRLRHEMEQYEIGLRQLREREAWHKREIAGKERVAADG